MLRAPRRPSRSLAALAALSLAGAATPAGTGYSGLARGEVARVDVGRGLVELRREGAPRFLHGTPGQLAGLFPGELVALPFEVFSGEAWVVRTPGTGEPPEDWFAVRGAVSGEVTRVRRAAGRFVVAGLAVRAHPRALDGLSEGTTLCVRYVVAGGERWLVRLGCAEGG